MKKKKEEERTFSLLKQWILIAPFMQKNVRISEECLQQSICCIFIFWLKEIFPAWSKKATTIYMRSAAVAQTNTAVAGTESFRSVPHQQEVLSIFAFLFLESKKE